MNQALRIKHYMDTICSISTSPGIGAIAVIRISGDKAFPIVNRFLKPAIHFLDLPPNNARLAELWDSDLLVDQVVLLKFAAPHSYNGEDMVEISCHGSLFVQQKILALLVEAGCRLAEPGEFTMRAFLNGKIDLPQAEAVSDLIDSQSETAHRLAVNQLKGGFSTKMTELRDQFIQLAALLELELDFSEEDVEFADRTQLIALLNTLQTEVQRLVESFRFANAVKTGVPVAIVGKPNVGKSTLLNALLEDERAIVSNIPGTTRDTIEDTFTIKGTLFRLIDTAGIRNADNEIEQFGIQRTFKTIAAADIILLMVDISEMLPEEIEAELKLIENQVDISNKKLALIGNKIDKGHTAAWDSWNKMDFLLISAKKGDNIAAVRQLLARFAEQQQLHDQTLLTNARHYDIMSRISQDIETLQYSISSQQPTDLLTVDVRRILHLLGQLTGTITDNDILHTIFGKFCIGK